MIRINMAVGLPYISAYWDDIWFETYWFLGNDNHFGGLHRIK